MPSPSRQPDNTRPLSYVLLKKYGIRGAWQVFVEDILFDLRHRINTFRPVSNKVLYAGGNITEQNRYVPSTVASINSILDVLSSYIDFESCDFIDIGSGKGKVAIIVSNCAFRKIKGVEYSEKLHQIALNNIRQLNLTDRVELLHQDANTYEFSEREQVVFFFNPFTGSVLNRCLQNLVRDDVTRYVVSMNPTEDKVFLRYLEKLEHHWFEPGKVEVAFYKTTKHTNSSQCQSVTVNNSM